MNISMDLSEILLYLDLMKREKKKPLLEQLYMMLYFLKDYDEVKAFYNKIIELNFKVPKKFYTNSLIHFIESYEDCINLRRMCLQEYKQAESILFIQQIMLSKSEEEAINIINESKSYGINLNEEVWSKRYDSIWRIKNDQKEWKKIIHKIVNDNFPAMYEEFCEMKERYFDSLSLKQLKQTLLEEQSNKNNRKVTQTAVYNRSVFIKEFARRVAGGICQLCDREAPFLDKQGKPFLEVHHIHYLSRGGSDTIDNVVALCPNCHRKIHQLELEEDIKKIKDRALKYANL